MIVAEVIVLVLGVLAMVLIHRREQHSLAEFFTARLTAQDEADEGRRVALYKMQKSSERAVARSDSAVRKLADSARHLHDETALAHQRTDALARDVKDKLGG